MFHGVLLAHNALPFQTQFQKSFKVVLRAPSILLLWLHTHWYKQTQARTVRNGQPFPLTPAQA